MPPTDSKDELLQCFDERGNPTEVQRREDVKALPPRWWYATSKVWLVNDQAQIMCSKRAEGLVGSPDKWQTYFGGHVAAGMTIKESAKKELAEEAGLDVPMEDFHLISAGHDDVKKVHYEFYAVRFNGQPADLHFTDHEVTEAKWLDMETYNALLAADPDAWCCPCKPEQQKLIREWLSS